ncbi:uncharacterized protein LOC141713885 [Apium graveolens]|uniref:uncharacterized protein LOC141713885 n=1 Tax=Apium graveolens TaxID=4045 RepID=UPI003D791E10
METNQKAQWVQVNSILGAWIQNTLDASIRSSVPITDNVKDMWDDIRIRFSAGNGPRINELIELASYLTPPCSCACTCGSKTALAKEREDESVHQFLSGLDSTIYENVQTNILMQDPLPSLNIVLNKAQTRERNHMLNRTSDKKNEVVGFAMQGTTRGRGTVRASERQKINVTCTHCGKLGHGQDNCFELLGYPDWWYAENRAAARGR